MTTKEIYKYLNKIYNFNSQEKWDNSTLHVHSDDEVKNIMICLDITDNLYHICVQNKVDLVISHHPLFTDPPNSQNFHTRKLLGKFKNKKISVLFLHTPFDKSIYGMNTELGYQIGLRNIIRADDEMTILGDIEPIKLSRLAKMVKTKLDSDHANYLERYKNVVVKKVAICGGSAFKNIFEILDNKFDVFITCDVKHHGWVDSVELDIPVISLNHNIENIFVDVISARLRELVPECNIIKAKSNIHIARI